MMRAGLSFAVGFGLVLGLAACGAPVLEPAAAPQSKSAIDSSVGEAAVKPVQAAPATAPARAQSAVAPTARLAAALPAAATATPRPAPAITLGLDASEIDAGGCTTLRWAVSNAVLVALDGQPVPDSGEREVCPQSSATYTLSVTPFAGHDEQRSVGLTVRQPSVAQAPAGGEAPGDGKGEQKQEAPPPPPPSPTPCEEECIVTPPPDDPFEPLPTLPPADPPPADPPPGPTNPPAPEPTSPPPPPEPGDPPPPQPPGPQPTP